MFSEVFCQPKLRQVAPDIYATPFLTEEYCERVLWALEQEGTWAPSCSRYPTQDIHLKNDLPYYYEEMDEHLFYSIWPLIQQEWNISDIELTDMFAVKYTLDGQKKLKLHHDKSYVTGSIKLNNDYDGAELKFPRQDFSNINIPVGDMIIWPSQITHPHHCSELLKGQKYSITIWTTEANSS